MVAGSCRNHDRGAVVDPSCRAIHDSRSLRLKRHSSRYRTADKTHVNATRRKRRSARRRSMTSLLVIRSLSSDTVMNVDPNVVEIAATGAEVKTSKTATW